MYTFDILKVQILIINQGDYMKNIINNSNDNLCVVNLEGEIIYSNYYLLKLMKLRKGDKLNDYFNIPIKYSNTNLPQYVYIQLENDKICPCKVYLEWILWENMPSYCVMIILEIDPKIIKQNSSNITNISADKELIVHLSCVQNEIIFGIQKLLTNYSLDILLEITSYNSLDFSIQTEFIITKGFKNSDILNKITLSAEEYKECIKDTDKLEQKLTIPSSSEQILGGGYLPAEYYQLSNTEEFIGRLGIQYSNTTDKMLEKDIDFIVSQTITLIYINQILKLNKPEISDINYNISYLQSCLNICADFIGVFNKAGIFLSVSEEVTKVLGWAPQELVGCSWMDFAHPDDIVNTQLQEYVGINSDNNRCIVTSRFRHKDNSYRWIIRVSSCK